LGGLAATEVYTGEKRMGSYSDIAKTKTIYESMARNGLLGFKNIGYFLSQRETVTPKEVDNEYTQLLNKIYQENIEILEANKQIAEALYVKLKDKRILSVDETKQILESFVVVNPFQK
jgi:ATP-dependent Zn protease